MTDRLVERGGPASHGDVTFLPTELTQRATGRTRCLVTQSLGLSVGHLLDSSSDQSLGGRRRNVLHVGQGHIQAWTASKGLARQQFSPPCGNLLNFPELRFR